MVKATTTSIWRAAAVFGAIVGGTMPLAANEVLPWANTPPTVATAEPATADPAMEAALAQCTPLFEAACRDLNTCAWIADVALQDGTVLPARCVARPSGPPKSTAKAKTSAPKKKTAETPKAPAAKPAAATAATETGAIPAKAEPKAAAVSAPTVVTPPPAVAEKKAPEAPVPVSAPPAAKAAAVEPPPATPQAAPVAEKQPAAAPPPAKTATTAPAAPKSPVSAKAPAPSGGSMPGFGSFSSAFPAGGAIVTTTVPPKTSSE